MTKNPNQTRFKRALLIILDSVGVGAMPDCKDYNDPPSVNTIQNTAKFVGGLKLPSLEQLGLGLLTTISGVKPKQPIAGAALRCTPKSKGKDTTTGHWEIAGLIINDPFQTFEHGFPPALIERFVRENNLPGILANHTASGTEIIKQYGMEHISTKKPIVYTSADSVFQIACHEEAFGLERLLKICESARKLCDEYRISRVIARPFIGYNAQSFSRTTNRKDYSIALPGAMLFDDLAAVGIKTHTIGKVANIYNFQSVNSTVKTINNQDGLQKLQNALDNIAEGLIVINLLDFDQEYGHRRNAKGYAAALEAFDQSLPAILSKLSADDLLLITADHGNDPTAPGTDHTREKVPLLIQSPAFHHGIHIEEYHGYDVICGTIYTALTGAEPRLGSSILHKLS